MTYGGLAGLGITILGLGPQAALIARWFIRRRGLAIGIAFAGTGIGSLLIIPGIEQVVSAFDWRTSYIVLAGLTFATLPFIVFLLRLNPADKGLHPDGIRGGWSHKKMPTIPVENWKMSDAVRTPTFWLLMLAALGAIGPVRVLSVHQLAILVEAGFKSSYAAIAIGSQGRSPRLPSFSLALYPIRSIAGWFIAWFHEPDIGDFSFLMGCRCLGDYCGYSFMRSY